MCLPLNESTWFKNTLLHWYLNKNVNFFCSSKNSIPLSRGSTFGSSGGIGPIRFPGIFQDNPYSLKNYSNEIYSYDSVTTLWRFYVTWIYHIKGHLKIILECSTKFRQSFINFTLIILLISRELVFKYVKYQILIFKQLKKIS